jgi:hypothetical protein
MNQKHSPWKKITAAFAIVLLYATTALATPTALTTQVLVQNNVNVTAGQLALTFTACDAVNGNSFISTGREVIIAQNTDTSAHTFTISSVPDALGRSDTSLTNYSLAATGSAGSTSVIQFKWQTGWLQSGGNLVNMTCSSNLIKFAILQFN